MVRIPRTQESRRRTYMKARKRSSVGDPDLQDPQDVFGPPGSGSMSQRYGSGSSSGSGGGGVPLFS